jgi:hypothetical protein
MKTLFKKLEFGGSGDPYIEALGCLRHPLATAPQVGPYRVLKLA